jgi:hypothetical protein
MTQVTDEKKQQLKQWVETWKRAGPELERMRREELRAYRHEDNVEAIDALLQIGYKHRRVCATSGLVEQQRIFMRATR